MLRKVKAKTKNIPTSYSADVDQLILNAAWRQKTQNGQHSVEETPAAGPPPPAPRRAPEGPQPRHAAVVLAKKHLRNDRERPETDPTDIISWSVPKEQGQHNGTKKVFYERCCSNGTSTGHKVNENTDLTPSTNISSKWIPVLHVNYKTMNF